MCLWQAMRIVAVVLALCIACGAAAALVEADDTAALDALPHAVLTTHYGRMLWRLRPDAAPKTVGNFRNLVETGFYNKSCIYRYERGFVLQGGGCGGRSSRKTVPLEYSLPNVKHSVALARTSDKHSGGSEFFINLRDNTQGLGPKRKGGYAVFAELIGGLTTVAKIKRLPTHRPGSLTLFRSPVPHITGCVVHPARPATFSEDL